MGRRKTGLGFRFRVRVRFVCRFFCGPKTGKKVIGLYVVFLRSENWEKSHRFVCRFFLRSENWEKSHRFVCRFFCGPKTGKKVIGLYVVFFAVGKLGKKS